MFGNTKKKSLLLAARADGFSLIEISIVLVIVGLILTTGMAFYRTTMKTSKWSGAKKELETINNSLKAFALTRGRLPCPDSVTVTPPVPDGVEDACTSCAPAPCGLPFTTLGVEGFDQWHHAQLQYEPQILLTTTNQETFCGTLYGIMNLQGTGAATVLPCVTDANDATDNGQIVATGLGYTVAAVVINDGDLLGLSGKNINADGEYEMARNPYREAAYNDIVGELTLNELFGDVCNTNNTKILLSGRFVTGVGGPPGTDDGVLDDLTAAWVEIGDIPCQRLEENGQLTVSIGQTVKVYPDVPANCAGLVTNLTFFDGTVNATGCTSCTTGPGFDLLDCDLCGGTPNGIVEIDGNTDGQAPIINDL